MKTTVRQVGGYGGSALSPPPLPNFATEVPAPEQFVDNNGFASIRHWLKLANNWSSHYRLGFYEYPILWGHDLISTRPTR